MCYDQDFYPKQDVGVFNNPECILLLDVTQESFVDRTTSTLIGGAKGVDICAHLAQIGMCRDVCKIMDSPQ